MHAVHCLGRLILTLDNQDELDDQESIISFRQYQSLDEQVQYLRTEVEKYRAVVDELQVWLSFDHHVSLRISVSENRTRKTSDVQVNAGGSVMLCCLCQPFW